MEVHCRGGLDRPAVGQGFFVEVLGIVLCATLQTGTLSAIRPRCCACTVRMVGLAGVSGAQSVLFGSWHGYAWPGLRLVSPPGGGGRVMGYSDGR